MDLNLLEFAALLGEMANGIREAEEKIVETGCQIIEARAKSAIGTYDFDWPQLAAATIAKKGANTPLLENGELRGSIEHHVERIHGGVVGFVGSNLDRAVYQELGTSKIPPRSFLREATIRSVGEIERMAESVISSELAAADMRVPHIALEAVKEVKDFAEDVVPARKITPSPTSITLLTRSLALWRPSPNWQSILPNW